MDGLFVTPAHPLEVEEARAYFTGAFTGEGMILYNMPWCNPLSKLPTAQSLSSSISMCGSCGLLAVVDTCSNLLCRR